MLKVPQRKVRGEVMAQRSCSGTNPKIHVVEERRNVAHRDPVVAACKDTLAGPKKLLGVALASAAFFLSGCHGMIPWPDDGSGDGGDDHRLPGTTDSSTGTSSEPDGSSGPGFTSTTSTEPEQCDINIDEPLEVDDAGHTFSPCYTVETFPCTTCELWCTTIGLDSCTTVISAAVCPPIETQGSADQCSADDIEGPFRCVCA
jgi:hypothetical protein